MPIQAGIVAPDFTLPDETGMPRTLSSFRGKPVVLYFYPKDDTPGCTKEACSIRDDYHLYRQAGAVVLGVSPDTSKSHTKFIEKYTLPFTLLADEDHKICELFGVWGPKILYGKSYEGVLRTTFLIGADGNIVKVFEKVKPEGHSTEILEALRNTSIAK